MSQKGNGGGGGGLECFVKSELLAMDGFPGLEDENLDVEEAGRALEILQEALAP